MVDSVQVYPPGHKVTDVNDNPVNNAKIKFREAGPGAPKTVYSDANLTIPLGSEVRTRADGQPVVSEGSSATTLIYVGADPYHIEVTDAADVVVVPAKDNVKGAAVLSPVAPVIPPVPVITTGSPLTLGLEHNGRLINANSNTLTFGNPGLLGDGWHVYIRNGGGSGQVTLSIPSGLSYRNQSLTNFTLEVGEAVEVVCDATAFRAKADISFAKVLITGGTIAGITSLAMAGPIDLPVATPPANPAADIARLYAISGSVLEYRRSDGLLRKLRPATQAEMEAAASEEMWVPPNRQHFHPGAVKFWARVNVSGGVPTLVADYGVASITDVNPGVLGVTFDTPFSSANYVVGVEVEDNGDRFAHIVSGQIMAGSVQVECIDASAGGNVDPISWHIWGFGDHGA
jgi:hypothetical protein